MAHTLHGGPSGGVAVDTEDATLHMDIEEKPSHVAKYERRELADEYGDTFVQYVFVGYAKKAVS